MAANYRLDGERLTEQELSASGRETQKEVMRQWFFSNYEDPAERTPYESAEGGYQWIWGGPYDAQEELEQAFTEIVPTDLIEELANELNRQSPEWAPVPEEKFASMMLEMVGKNTEFYSDFDHAMIDIQRLLEAHYPSQSENCLHRLLYVNVITALEAFLDDAFTNTVLNNEKFLRRFVEHCPEFQQEKVKYADIFKLRDEVVNKVKEYLGYMSWHNLNRVIPLFKDILGLNQPDDFEPLLKAVLLRHDLVHRNGKTKDGQEIYVSSADIRKLIEHAENLAQCINDHLNEINMQDI